MRTKHSLEISKFTVCANEVIKYVEIVVSSTNQFGSNVRVASDKNSHIAVQLAMLPRKARRAIRTFLL